MTTNTTRTGRPSIGPKNTIRLPEADWAALDARAATLGIRDRSDLMRTYIAAGLARPIYTIQIEAASTDGKTWQAIHPAETVEAEPGETATDIAKWTASNQTIADGDLWRVVVWEGDDTNGTPDHAHYEPAEQHELTRASDGNEGLHAELGR